MTGNIIIFLVLWLPVNLSLFCFLLPVAIARKHENRSATLSCGDFHNIRCPFTLKGAANPHHCWFPVELGCDENNRTIFGILPWQNFYVIDINYKNQSIRIVDPGLQRDNSSSMPWYSLPRRKDFRNNRLYLRSEDEVFYMNCSTRVDSPYYVDTSPCINASSSNNTYSYIVWGGTKVKDLKDTSSCKLWMISGMGSSVEEYEGISKFSCHDFHQKMSSGFELRYSDDFPLELDAQPTKSKTSRMSCVMRPRKTQVVSYLETG